MSAENVELHRRLFRALNAHDAEAMVELCDPEVEIHSIFAAVGGADYHGHAGVRSWQRNLDESWQGEYRIETEAFFDLGEHTVVFGVQRGRGPHSGVEVEMQATGVARWRNGRCVSHKAYVHREDALAELGVTEDELREAAV